MRRLHDLDHWPLPFFGSARARSIQAIVIKDSERLFPWYARAWCKTLRQQGSMPAQLVMEIHTQNIPPPEAVNFDAVYNREARKLQSTQLIKSETFPCAELLAQKFATNSGI